MSTLEERIENNFQNPNYLQIVRRLGKTTNESDRLAGEFRKVTKLMDRVAKGTDPTLKALAEIIRVNSEKARDDLRHRIKVLSQAA